MSSTSLISKIFLTLLFSSLAYGEVATHSLRFRYNFATAGGSDIGTIRMGPTLPAWAIITRSYLYVLTQENSIPPNATTAMSCGPVSMLDPADKTGVAAGAFIAGKQDNTIPNFIGIGGTACYINMQIASGVLSQGHFLGYIEYVLGR